MYKYSFFFFVATYFKIFHSLSFIILVENNEQSNQPCPWPGLALLSTFILHPLDIVMS